MKKPNPEDRSVMRRETHATRKVNEARKLFGVAAVIPVLKSRRPAGLREPDQLVLPLDDFRKPRMGFMSKARDFIRGAFRPFASARSG